MFDKLDKRIKLALTLAIISGVSALLLALVNDITSPVIEKNRKEQTLKLYSEIFTDMTDYEEIDASDKVDSLVLISNNGEELGVICSATGTNGYGGITALVGYNANKEVTGIEYSYFNQTPGFGDKVKSKDYKGQYLNAVFGDATINAASGATYSSNLVLDLVTTCSSEVDASYSPSLQVEEE